ncbi:asparagine synthetase B family protein [Aetokthonos hydrillicola Thurmond2011]|jgi:asparagine synthase (glutamine-hydrolysing)|uniref:asparagine synthase (glutamine-hydrolyzing) n=1 Tax=Aetokthonos hydrillicola Thurmond2011 TaxID=2712845 RepID=A0AAP5IDH5_9CYAN|nr:asparagine synthetase B family protein [Aetokthonos hydrillicola]MBO3459163.1 asparagine synthase [Aetokthonos hydrillicola CCALA 1050]MBW4584122.1 asparagine synthase [Aetokthonos hydrillicola CCALA 1050]MDR9898344.1 asparagine synthetase B family protein [Aetokthonos hydrillicola Thurmond2011]
MAPICPSHFVGYWGYASQSEEVLLCSIAKQHYQPLDTRKNPVWNVAFISDDQNSIIQLDNNIIASLSAAGIHDRPDVWVRLSSNTTLFLGRDIFGRVPLYWIQLGQVIWFASQLQLLLPLLDAPQVNIAAVYGYSCFSYVPTPLTPVVGIQAIGAGTEIAWSFDDEILLQPKIQRLQEWWEESEKVYDEVTAVTELQILLKDAIARQVSDTTEPVGVCLSGGLDSSIIAALLVQAGIKVKAYTLDFGNYGIPEHPYAEQVAQYLQIPLVKVDASPRNISKALIPTVKALDLPFGDGVTVPLYLLVQRASQETEVIFNGENGDQLFGGWTNKPLIAAGIYQAEHPSKDNFIQQYLRTFHRLWGYDAYQADISELHAEDWLREALDAQYSDTLLHRLRRANLMLKGAQNIQPRATNIGLSQGLAVRSPFCDLPLTRWSFRLSGELILHGNCEKYILKRAVENWLPPEIVWRQKRGMGVPLTSWCLHEFWHQLGDWLKPSILRREGIFKPDIAVKIVNGELSAAITGRRIGEILWLLVMWELWRVHILGEAPNSKEFFHPFILPRWMWRFFKKLQV